MEAESMTILFCNQADRPYPRYLSHNEGIYYELVWHDCCPDSGAVGLPIAFQNAGHQSNVMLFTANQITISIFNYQNQYFLFDSLARNSNGLPDHHCFAITIRFQIFKTWLITCMQYMYILTTCITCLLLLLQHFTWTIRVLI
jgi:hypothetical protein